MHICMYTLYMMLHTSAPGMSPFCMYAYILLLPSTYSLLLQCVHMVKVYCAVYALKPSSIITCIV